MVTALFVGRFQPFHKGHEHATRALLRTCDRAVIAVGSTNRRNVDNPFSYSERRAMITASLTGKELRRCRIIGVPDVADDRTWGRTLLKKVKPDVIVTANLHTKVCFPDFPVKKPALLDPARFNGTRIRNLIRTHGQWRALIPPKAIPVIERALRTRAGDFLKHV